MKTDGLPPIIKIGPYDFRVTALDKSHKDNEDDWGQFISSTQEIQIAPDITSRFLAVDTVLHELLHGAWWVGNAKAEDGEERIIGALATHLTQIFRDNPALLSWIQRALKP